MLYRGIIYILQAGVYPRRWLALQEPVSEAPSGHDQVSEPPSRGFMPPYPYNMVDSCISPGVICFLRSSKIKFRRGGTRTPDLLIWSLEPVSKLLQSDHKTGRMDKCQIHG